MNIKKLLTISFLLIVIISWIFVGTLNFSSLSLFVEHSFYWSEVVMVIYLILTKKVSSGNLLFTGIALLMPGSLLNILGLYLGEIILRFSLVILLLGTIFNLFDYEK